MGWNTSTRTWRLPGGLLVGLLSCIGIGMVRPAHAAPVSTAAIPDYVMKYAPLIWIHSEDPYNPSDFSEMLRNSVPQIDYKPINTGPSALTLDNLNELNALGGREIFLTSREGIQAIPTWFKGVRPNKERRTENAVCSVIVVTDHGQGNVDAFYFYFYTYNQGNTVLGLEFGSHVGDWEHNMIRFRNGKPRSIWYSQHATGQAFTFGATTKIDGRPVGYSANGTHATLPSGGVHDHTVPGLDLPRGFLEDYTDGGVLWDPTLNAYAYHYNKADGSFTPSTATTPVNWLHFEGAWGDEQLPDDAEGQVNIFGQRRYTSGPTGPKFKNLSRKEVCPDSVKWCIVLPFLT